MKPRTRTRSVALDARVEAPARVGRRTKDLAKQIAAGEIAVIDHRDIDRVAGDSLVAAKVAAVVNAAPSISGRYPNGGPRTLADAGIPVLDAVGSEVMDAIRDGETLVLEGDTLLRPDGTVVARGQRMHSDEIDAAMEAARQGIGTELRSFAHNTLEYIDREADLAFEPLPVPELRTQIKGRHALVVVRGHDYQQDLLALKPYIREFRPVLIAVDGGADALLDIGLKPEIIIGDFDSLSDTALMGGAELIAHAHPDGRSPASELLAEHGLAHHVLPAAGMSEDIAMLVAYEAGATLIVAVGTHATMVEFLDKGRRGMASTFLTRLRLGPMLVDAKGVNRLYQSRVRRRDILMLVVAALIAMVVMVAVAAPLRTFLDGFRQLWLEEFWRTVTHWF